MLLQVCIAALSIHQLALAQNITTDSSTSNSNFSTVTEPLTSTAAPVASTTGGSQGGSAAPSGTSGGSIDGGLTGTNLILAIAIPVGCFVLVCLCICAYYFIFIRPKKVFDAEYGLMKNKDGEPSPPNGPSSAVAFKDMFPTSLALSHKQQSTAMTELQFQLAIEEDPMILQEMLQCSSPILTRNSPRHYPSDVIHRRQSQMASRSQSFAPDNSAAAAAASNNLATELLQTHLASDNKKLSEKKRLISTQKEKQLRAHLLDVTINSKRRSRSTCRLGDDGDADDGDMDGNASFTRNSPRTTASEAAVILRRGDGRLNDLGAEAAYFQARFVDNASRDVAMRSGVEEYERKRGNSAGPPPRHDDGGDRDSSEEDQ